MTEAEWLAATDPKSMLIFLPSKTSKRKLRLLAVACCRKIWGFLRDDAKKVTNVRWQKRVLTYSGGRFDPFTALESAERVVEIGESFADGLVRVSELEGAHAIADKWYFAADGILNLIVNERLPQYGDKRTEREIFAAMLTSFATASQLKNGDLGEILDYRANTTSDLAEQAHLLQDIFANPYRKVRLNRNWLTSTVVALAEGIYKDRAFDRMPILADALQDAGCSQEDVLNHCREPGEHVRGCWVVDLLLGKT